ncbi:MAG TPA: TIGR03435 family protein, partial [Candidatus Acidoferrum sp.]|nr:TIGR03435 family protein [Candidatus Acidoferrum sp.]
GRYEVRNATMVDLVRTAYNVDADKVLGGPSWLEMDRFDVFAKVAGKASADAQRTMLRTLLADRFQLVLHNETQSMPAYSMTAGKHPALKKSDAAGNSGCKFAVRGMGPQAAGAATPITAPVFQYTCRNVTMAAFAVELRRMPAAQQYLRDVPVLDKTGLEGAWDFDFKYSLRGPAATQADVVTLPDAVEKQLGLKLEVVKVPMPVLVVDSVNQKPTADPPGAEEALKLAAAPTEFEVADVKPSDPDSKGMRFNIQPGGRVNISGLTLKALIQQAWSLTEDMIVGGPKWLDSDRYDIIAKAPAAAQEPGTANGSSAAPVDIDTVWIMLRGLLKDRFKLEVHNEERPISAYTLLAVNPKLKKADPTSRTRFVEGPATDAKDPRNANPALSRLVTVQNMTMTQFAAQLQRIAPGYIRVPVLDATGLEGAYSFTLSFSPAGMARGGGGGGGRGGMIGMDAGPASPGAPDASDPSGAIPLPQAIEKQLGLKLELQKRPMNVLVIDRIERTPTEN